LEIERLEEAVSRLRRANNGPWADANRRETDRTKGAEGIKKRDKRPKIAGSGGRDDADEQASRYFRS